MSQYSTNLTDKQWQVIEKNINPQERQRKHQLRDIMNAILYINKTGCQWRMLPSHFAPWQTVYYCFRKWKLEGVIEDIMDTLHSLVRKMIGREESPSMGIIDSRSVKTSHHVDSDRGIDGNKKIKGRKEHIVVDTLGLPMAVAVHEANLHDSKGARRLSRNLNTSSRASVRYLQMAGTKAPLVTGWLESSAGSLKSCFAPMNVPVSSKSS